jgi:hypothetical protein
VKLIAFKTLVFYFFADTIFFARWERERERRNIGTKDAG